MTFNNQHSKSLMQNFKLIIVLIALSLATKIQAQQTSFSFNGEEINGVNF
ncbi:hypothetical protein SAMN05660903_00286 [Salegentibacter salinarum]|nr:hypothetical protein SAMN05660903_00286 [Salegentibacter salinarum]